MSARRAARGLVALAILVTSMPVSGHIDAARPEVVAPAKRLYMISDSVGLGAIPQMTAAFAGWQVTVAGKPGLFTEQLAATVRSAPSSVLGENAIVATGYNYPYWDPPRFAASVDLMVATLKARGVKRIFWVTVREVKPAYYSSWGSLSAPYRTLYLAYPTANAQLRAATARHPELSLIDWASIADRTGLTYDAIHLNPTGAAQYAGLARTTVTTALTRAPAGKVAELAVAGTRGVPADARAVSVNIHVTNPRTAGSVTVYPCGSARPPTAQLWTKPALTAANGAVVALDATGKLCVYTSVPTHVQLDIDGAFTASSGYVDLRGARRLDTRSGAAPAAGAVRQVALTIAGAPPPPFTAAVNITTIAKSAGTVQVYTCGVTPPGVPTRAFDAGETQNLLQLVRTDAAGRICVKTTGGTHVVVDELGALPAGTDLRMVRNARVLDTRTTGALAAGAVRTIPATAMPWIPSGRGAGVTAAVSLVRPTGSGAATVYPCAATPPAVTTVPVLPNHMRTNAVTIGLSATGSLCVRTSVTTHVIVDVSSWLGTAFASLRPVRVLDTRP